MQAADNKVPQQQQQIEAMVEQGAEVIVVGPIDGTQLVPCSRWRRTPASTSWATTV
ncbi:MAG: hypothetical protein R2722_09335 [Tessaracoccus sp.]